MRTFREKELTVREAAAELGTDTYGIFQLINAGELKAHRFGGHYRITPGQIAEYLLKKSTGEGKENGGLDEA